MTERLRECEAALRAALSGDFGPAEAYLALDALGGEQKGVESELFCMYVGAIGPKTQTHQHWCPHRLTVVKRLMLERPDARLRLRCISGTTIVAGMGANGVGSGSGVAPFFLQQGHYSMRVKPANTFQIDILNPTSEQLDVGQLVGFGYEEELA